MNQIAENNTRRRAQVDPEQTLKRRIRRANRSRRSAPRDRHWRVPEQPPRSRFRTYLFDRLGAGLDTGLSTGLGTPLGTRFGTIGRPREWSRSVHVFSLAGTVPRRN